MSDLRTAAELGVAKVLTLASRWLPGQYAPEAQPESVQTYVFGQAPVNELAIPKIIWAYWDGVELPALIEKCLQNWRRTNPDFDIRLLNAATLVEWTGPLPEGMSGITEQRKSDWIRLKLLAEYGGIWLDASTILTRSLQWVIDAQHEAQSDFLGCYLEKFTANPAYPVIESWFLAAPLHSRFIEHVLQEFSMQVIAKNGKEYVEHLKRQGVYEDVLQLIDDPDYLSIHMCMQYVMQGLRTVPQSGWGVYRLSLIKAEDGAYFFHAKAGWKKAKLKQVLFFKLAPKRVPSLIKLRAPDRKRLDLYVQSALYRKGSIVDKYLMQPNVSEPVS